MISTILNNIFLKQNQYLKQVMENHSDTDRKIVIAACEQK